MKQNYFHNCNRNSLRLSWTGFFALLLMMSVGLSSLKAQVSGYVFSQTTGSFTAISGGNVLGTATGNAIGTPSLDTEIYPVTLPFAINFNNVNYTDVSVSSNGYLTFGTTAASGTTPISSTIAWGGVVSAWGRDLNTVFDIAGKTGNMSWKAEGTAPNRTIVFQWENFRPAYTSSTTSAYVFSFQIRLAETTNVISTVYSAGGFLIGSSASSATNTQIGLRGTTNTDYNNRFNPSTIAFGSSTTGTVNSNGQSFNTVNDPPGMPADGLTYTWTPPTCLGPSALGVANITTTSADLSWTASGSAPANGYDIYYSMSNTAPVGSTIPNFTNIAGLTQSLSALTPSSQYFVWVRSVCSNSDKSNWVALPSFNTACAPITSMYENFDGYATGSVVPNCWDRIISGSGTQTISSSGSNSAPNNLYQYSTLPANQTIVVLPVFSNISAGTHWLRLKARVTSAPRTIEFGYVTNATDANSFVLIEAKSITNTAYTSTDAEYTIVIPTTVPANARLAIKNPGTLSTTFYYDDVYWELAPTCLPPTNIVTSNATATSIDVSWTASPTPPGNGYDVYVSTNNTPPTVATVPTLTGVMGTSATISGLTPLTGYFVWVRAKCSAIDASTYSAAKSFSTACQPPAITGTGATVCPNNTATLTATTDPGATIHWSDASGTELATGPSFTTPSLAATTTYYVSSSVGVSGVPVGKTTYTPSQSSGAGTTNFGLVFDVLSPFTISSVTIYPVSATGASGTVTIDIIDGNNTILHTITENVVGAPISAPVAHVVNLGFYMQVGTNYKMRPGSYTGISGIVFDPSANAPAGNYGYPFSYPGFLSINSSTLSAPPGNLARLDLYYYFYDWKISTQCKSASQPVVATVDPACLSTSEIDKAQLKIYPNPFVDYLIISDVSNIKTLYVMDMTGRILKTIEKPQTKINLSELSSGMYIINMKFNDDSTHSMKVIKK